MAPAAPDAATQAFFGNGGDTPDRANVVERVQLGGLGSGDAVTITVTAFTIPSLDFDPTPLQYALAVIGDFRKRLVSSANPARRGVRSRK